MALKLFVSSFFPHRCFQSLTTIYAEKFRIAVKRFKQLEKAIDKTTKSGSEKIDATSSLIKISNLLSLISETDKIKVASNDVGLATVVDDEVLSLQNEVITEVNKLIALTVLPPNFLCNSAVLSLNAGVGGKEAMLFALDLFNMYKYHASWCGLDFEPKDVDVVETGGCRHAYATVTGPAAYKKFIFEAGVHRVQRVPETEKSGRIHTSTATVAVLSHSFQAQVELDPSELKITTFRSSGPGGQRANKTETAVRIVHLPTGLHVERTKERSQERNMENAKEALKTLLLHREIESHRDETLRTIKNQVGSANRNERIRTYNFLQDRVTDHRINKSFGNLSEFMLGGERLSVLSDLLLEWYIDDCLK